MRGLVLGSSHKTVLFKRAGFLPSIVDGTATGLLPSKGVSLRMEYRPFFTVLTRVFASAASLPDFTKMTPCALPVPMSPRLTRGARR